MTKTLVKGAVPSEDRRAAPTGGGTGVEPFTGPRGVGFGDGGGPAGGLGFRRLASRSRRSCSAGPRASTVG